MATNKWHTLIRECSPAKHLSDELCEQILALAKARYEVHHTVRYIGARVAIVVIACGIALLYFGFAIVLVASGRIEQIALALLGLAVVAAAPVGAWRLRRNREIRLAIRETLRRHVCRCGYSLIGVPPDQGEVVCPECGTPTPADDYGVLKLNQK